MVYNKRFINKILSVLILLGLLLGIFSEYYIFADNYSKGSTVLNSTYFSKLDELINTNQEAYYDSNAIYRLPETVSQEDDISVIVSMKTDSLIDLYNKEKPDMTVSQFVSTTQAQNIQKNISKEREELIALLKDSSVDYTLGDEYDTILSGFEITIKAKDFEKVSDLFSSKADLILGETYSPCTTEVVTNLVDVYPTGIFDSSASKYQGDGVVVAILDTGLDYTHSAFNVNNFSISKEVFTLDSIRNVIKSTQAASFSSGLTGDDVYISKKIPFAYDYADKDPDVLPINSEHGTHVAGIIAGKDDTITGVAPSAQLAIMKVFSDTREGAKDSWIMAALEDCVILGVDVINMSLGTSCGFSREVDKEKANELYDSIREAGISLILAASNDSNATRGSDKNGSNGLTTNPDSGTVGSPSTYESGLSVASVDGVKTPYILYGNDIIYFTEASTSSAKTKKFVDDILSTLEENVDSYEFEYVTIPGIGRSSDYLEENSYYEGKIVLVKRGTTTFEEKVRIALKEKGAAGIIIYNNISGSISMSVGESIGAVCSISQDEGEKLAAFETGKIKISREQVAGPFMSDFSSWGPTSDLKIKPEITAHGGEILSAVPGQGYERLSGTSMAAPNLAGATAIIRQYVKYSGVFGDNLTADEVTSIVNQLMMSTADIVYNKNGLPYAVRKQGAGLVNILKATNSVSYLSTYDKDGNLMDKTKLELGDDKNKSGIYEMIFCINNLSNKKVAYDISSVVLTEGVSSTYTSHGDTTVTQEGYLLSGATSTVISVENGTQDGNTVYVDGNGKAKVTLKVVLSDQDKKYLDDSFKYGMYVEGFVTLKALTGANEDLNIPFLSFYGDWTQAPIFDEEYYDTNADEINQGIDPEDKLMPDAYATRVIGGLYSDYIATLGSYYFTQDPSATQIPAQKDHIALSNQESEISSTICRIESIWAGLLRNVKEVNISIVEDSTGKEIFNKTSYNQRKSFSSGNTVYSSGIDVDFDVLENQLKNNTKYTATVTTYIDYGEKEDQKNERNTFEFPIYIDYEAPIITGVTYRTEYDKTTKKTKLFADISIYDNHYAMAMQLGQIVPAEEGSDYSFTMMSFGKYITPVYSSFNSTSVVTVELTDYISRIKNSAGLDYINGNASDIVYNNNSYVATLYDYAMNAATYEIRLPDEIISMYFTESELKLNPNETKDLSTILNIYPSDSWLQVLDFTSSDKETVDVVNNTVIAKKSGNCTITAIGYDKDGNKITASTEVKVLSPEDEGYKGGYTIPEVNKFTLTGYKTLKAYYGVSSDERKIGMTGGNYEFNGDYNLTMFPSESVKLEYILDSYFPDKTTVSYKAGNSKIATVSEDGTIVAQAEGTTIISVNVSFDGKTTLFSGRVSIKVENPFITNSIYLTAYKGLGGEVTIPSDRGITTINPFAFSNYEYVPKDLENGDEINDEDPYKIKQWYIGEDTITKVIIPEGVTEIKSYAFANLTGLEEIVLPTTLTKIGVGAFEGCTKLKKINLENVKFINKNAFKDCALETIDLSSVVAIGDYSFQNCKLNYIVLPKTAQSLGKGAFANNQYLTSVEFNAKKIKLGSYSFSECPKLSSVNINANVISSYAFYNCSSLSSVTLGRDVSVIGEFAFAGTQIGAFDVDVNNNEITAKENGALLFKGTELILAAPLYSGVKNTVTTDAEKIGTGAFAGNTKIFKVYADNATVIGDHAFDRCTNLQYISLNSVKEIGDYALFNTSITSTPDFTGVSHIGKYSFAGTAITTVEIPDNSTVGEYAFSFCRELTKVILGNNVVAKEGSFYCPVFLYTLEQTGNLSHYSVYTYEVKDELGQVVETNSYYRYNFLDGVVSKLKEVSIGDCATLEKYAFAGNAKLSEVAIGDKAIIGDYSFFNDVSLSTVDLSKAEIIGEGAFSGISSRDYCLKDNVWSYAFRKEYSKGNVLYVDYMSTFFAPSLETIDISNVTSLGKNAFAGNSSLENITFGDKIDAIPDYAFSNCSSISNITIPEKINSIGENAFYGSNLKTVNLSNIAEIGKGAFAISPLEKVIFKEGVNVGDSAFMFCYKLATANNINKVNTIGKYAFGYTSLTDADLSGAVSIGDYAFGYSALTSVKFGDKLEELGQNPFLMCEIKTFGQIENVVFNNNTITTKVEENYVISDKVQVINGVLYQKVPNGLELSSYPLLKEDNEYVIENGTVRVSDKAFMGSDVQSVTLPSTLKAIGDKAFYDCNDLSLVVFKSYYAPTLEEAFDQNYMSYGNLPLTGFLNEYEGLGVSDYYMWNATSRYSNFYYGANFKDYIGHITSNLVMVKPANGVNYDTFIMSQYFSTKVLGSNSATDNTESVIGLIGLIPKSVTLNDKQLVEKARNAYNNIPSVEQQALVTNYSVLVSAESTIAYLELRNQQDNDNNNDNDPANDSPKSGNTGIIILSVVAGIALLGCVAYFLFRKKKKETLNTENDGAESEIEEESGNEVEENSENAVDDNSKDDPAGENTCSEEPQENSIDGNSESNDVDNTENHSENTEYDSSENK